MIKELTGHVCITGGTGFFGRALLRYIIKKQINISSKITVLSRNPDKFLCEYPEFSGHQSITFRSADMQDRDSLPWDEKFTHILHAATDSTLAYKLTPLEQFEQSLGGTKNILDLAIVTGAERFLFY